MVQASRGRAIEERMRRVALRATERIARRYCDHFPMWIGCGFPRTDTVWLCKLMSGDLCAIPQSYALPIAMRAVVRTHWDYHPGMPTTAYIHVEATGPPAAAAAAAAAAA